MLGNLRAYFGVVQPGIDPMVCRQQIRKDAGREADL